MTDIDALIERLKNTSEDLFYATPCTAKLMCEQAAAALERMREEARQIETEGAKYFEWAMADKMRAQAAEAEVTRVREALLSYTSYPCPACSGDCEGAEPPMLVCPTQLALKALAQRSE